MERCYLVHVTLHGKPSATRIAEAATGIKALLTKISPEHELAYTSNSGETFGFFMKSELPAYKVANQLISPGSDDLLKREKRPPSPLRADDTFMILELGLEQYGYGARATTWIEFHHPKSTRGVKPATAPAESKGQSQLASQLATWKEERGKKKS